MAATEGTSGSPKPDSPPVAASGALGEHAVPKTDDEGRPAADGAPGSRAVPNADADEKPKQDDES